MGKNLSIKAFVLLIVIFFHSFVLVPRAHATTWEGNLARDILWGQGKGIPPSVIGATPAGRGYLIAMVVASAVIYVAIKSGYVTALKNWWNNTQSQGTYPSDGAFVTSSGQQVYITEISGWWRCFGPEGGEIGQGAATRDGVVQYMGGFTNGAHWGTVGNPVTQPTVPTDYSASLATSQPAIGSNNVFVSPGGSAQIFGGDQVFNYTEMSDSQLASLITAMGMTAPNNAGNQAGNPAKTDNTVTQGDLTSQGILSQIAAYVSNLIGIKTDTGKLVVSTDCVAATLGNINTNIQGQADKMDNMAIAINTQTEIDNALLGKMDNVAQTLDTFKNTATDQSTLANRITGVKAILLTKFPFSLVASVTAPGSVSGGTYTIPDLQFPLGTVVSVDPMQNTAIHDFITWVRGVVAVGMWSVFILVMVRRVTQL